MSPPSPGAFDSVDREGGKRRIGEMRRPPRGIAGTPVDGRVISAAVVGVAVATMLCLR